MRQLATVRVLADEALTGCKVQIAPERVGPDNKAPQGRPSGQESLCDVQQCLALTFQAVESALPAIRRLIHHEQRLAIELVGKRGYGVIKTPSADVFDR